MAFAPPSRGGLDECPCYYVDMAQPRHRKPVALTLDPDVRRAADDLLAKLPTKVSLSALVDELLEGFVTQVGPLLDDLLEADPSTRITAMHAMTGRLLGVLGAELAETVRAIESTEVRKE